MSECVHAKLYNHIDVLVKKEEEKMEEDVIFQLSPEGLSILDNRRYGIIDKEREKRYRENYKNVEV